MPRSPPRGSRRSPHARWLCRERDLDGDWLLTIMLPDESGLDDSPKCDEVYGRLAHRRPGCARLVQRCRDPRRGLFFDLAGRAERRVEVSTWPSLAPLDLPRGFSPSAPG
jgi:hypothetical protein